MADQIVDDLSELFPDEISMQAGTTAGSFKGAFAPSGSPVTVPCRISGHHRVFRGESGQERVSTTKATLAGVYGATMGHRYTLPARYTPRQVLAIAVEIVSDENGPHHEIVFF